MVLFGGLVSSAFPQATLPENGVALRAVVPQHAPIGTAIGRAKPKVESLGFTCSWVEGKLFVGLEKPVVYYYCSFASGVPVAKRWQLALVPRGGKVDDVRAAFGLVGP